MSLVIRFTKDLSSTWTSLSDKDRNDFTNLFFDKAKNFNDQPIYLLGAKVPADLLKRPETQHINTEVIQETDFVKNISSKHPYLLCFDGIYPLWNEKETDRLLKLHLDYQPDASLIENAVPGTVPIIIGNTLSETIKLQGLTLETPVAEYIVKKVSYFHIEVEYSEPDLRMLRLDARLTSKNKVRFVKAMLDLAVCKKTEWLSIFKQQPSILVDQPHTIELELTSKCNYACKFCPRQHFSIPQSNLEKETLNLLISWSESLAEPVSYLIGGMGEPTLHPHMSIMLNLILNSPKCDRLVIETNGSRLETLTKFLPDKRVSLILNINSIDHYQVVHGTKTSLEDISSKILLIPEEFRDRVFVQMLKIQDNIDQVDKLYAWCTEKKVSFLLQKYNSYAGCMKERRVSDLTPFERYPCWHLRRDLFVFANGDVSFCKQIPDRSNVRGNIIKDELNKIWSQQTNDFTENYRGKFPLQPACVRCDEYFTFNY